MKILLALSFSIGLSAVVQGQGVVPPLLLHAAQCLEAKTFLPPSKAASLDFGYFLDTSSYPNERVLYVVEFDGSNRSRGLVFTIVLDNNGSQQVFAINNNARFARSKDGFSGIDFPDPPLGGIWTQEHIVSAIKRIQGGASYLISEKDLLGAPPDIQCESYADRK